jgi:predicted MPP superfamily phosphohydrolase
MVLATASGFLSTSIFDAALVQFVFFGACCVGHVGLVVVSLNLWYSQPFRRKLLHAVRAAHAVLALAGPVALWLLFGFDLRPALAAGNALTFYLIVCAVMGLVVVPAVTAWRLVRGQPAVLLSNHTHTVDVAAQLGHRPVGRGKYRLLAQLPGNEIFRVDFNEKTIRLPQLPAAWDGLTILHLSDLHLSGSPDRAFYQYVMDHCRTWEPDLVAITGDIVDSHHHHRWVVPVLGRLRWRVGAFGVLGNHDYWHNPDLVRRRLRRLNIDVLGNGWRQITVRGEPLIVVGHEGPWFQPIPDLADCPANIFRLCLSHTPDNIGWGRREEIDLMLAGHNHGGQIRLPLIGSLFVPSRHSRRYDCGTFHEPPTVLHVSRGLGGQQPVRYNCKPEVTLVVLRRGQ